MGYVQERLESRKAFTLVELRGVVGIIGVVVYRYRTRQRRKIIR